MRGKSAGSSVAMMDSPTGLLLVSLLHVPFFYPRDGLLPSAFFADRSRLIPLGILLWGLAVAFEDLRLFQPRVGRVDPFQLHVELPAVAEVVEPGHRLAGLQRQVA